MYVLDVPDKRGSRGRSYQRLTVSAGQRTPLGEITLAGVVFDAEPIMPRRLRILDDVVISVVERGTGRYRFRNGTTVPIVGPSLTLVLPGEPHWYGTEPGERWTEWFAVVHGPLFDTVLASRRPLASGPRPLPTGVRVADLARILGRRAGPANAEEQVWQLARWLTAGLSVADPDDDARWVRARELLTDDPSLEGRIDLAEVAADVGLGYDAFRRQFRQRFGQSPLAFRNAHRLDVAASLLRLTSLSCREIADRLGYCDEFHLSRRFAARFGVSPTAYRNVGPGSEDVGRHSRLAGR